MALRSVMRKMPALALRSPAVGMAVRALSPAAGPRLMSHRAQETEAIKDAMETYRRELALCSASRDAALRRCKEYKDELERVEKVCDAVLIACPVVLFTVWMLTKE